MRSAARALSAACLVLQLLHLGMCGWNQGKLTKGVGWAGGAGGRGMDARECALSRQVVCHNFEHLYQEIFNTEATFVAYLHITGDTLQLHRFEPVHDKPGVFRAYYHDYGKGLVYKSKILVLRNTSAPNRDEDKCARQLDPYRIYRRYRFNWYSTGQGIRRSAGAHFRVAPAAGTQLADLKKAWVIARQHYARFGRAPEHSLLTEANAAKIDTLVQFHLTYAQDPASQSQPRVSTSINLHLWRLKHALGSICFFGDSVFALFVYELAFGTNLRLWRLCIRSLLAHDSGFLFGAYVYRISVERRLNKYINEVMRILKPCSN